MSAALNLFQLRYNAPSSVFARSCDGSNGSARKGADYQTGTRAGEYQAQGRRWYLRAWLFKTVICPSAGARTGVPSVEKSPLASRQYLRPSDEHRSSWYTSVVSGNGTPGHGEGQEQVRRIRLAWPPAAELSSKGHPTSWSPDHEDTVVWALRAAVSVVLQAQFCSSPCIRGCPCRWTDARFFKYLPVTLARCMHVARKKVSSSISRRCRIRHIDVLE